MITTPTDRAFRIRLGGAHQAREEGVLGIDSIAADSVDEVVDLKAPPWPLEANVVDTLFASFYFHRLTKPERWQFIDECYRVLKPGAQLIMVMPHWSSMRAITDPLAEWPPLCESSFMVYSKQWREQEQMTDLPLNCDFGSVYGYGHTITPDMALRNDEYQQHAKNHWLNAVMDLHVTLTKN